MKETRINGFPAKGDGKIFSPWLFDLKGPLNKENISPGFKKHEKKEKPLAHRVFMAKKPDPQDWKKPYGNKSWADNYYRAVEWREPDWIPCSMSIFPAVWARHRQDLKALACEHPFVFGTMIKHKRSFDKIPMRHQPGVTWTDNWGCVWQGGKGGYEGVVVGHPLASWDAFEDYEFLDLLKYTETGKRIWRGVKPGLWLAKKTGLRAAGGGGRLFDRMYFLRGFDNLMMDIARDHPMLSRLVEKLQERKIALVDKWLKMGAQEISFHTDIGTQDRLMMRVSKFRKHIKPMFNAIFQRCREGGAHVYLSSDGHLLEIVDDLVECGVSVHDPQERANTIEGIAKAYKGKLCVDLDLDRQGFPFSTPARLKKNIKHAIDTIGSPEGGLMFKAEISDANVPLENIKAILEAFEEYCIPRR